jgi:2-polyprenyl-3-methyl-5-hydroxy-6-metoxy-1,4-benzoquinol methylase
MSQVRQRLYERYASTHAGLKHSEPERRLAKTEIGPHLAGVCRDGARIVDLGCGQGKLVEALLEMGFTDVLGVDISPEQVDLARSSGLTSVECGDYRDVLARYEGEISAVIATDFLEHFSKEEVVEVFDRVGTALRPNGVFVVRSPNGTSPFFGNYQYSDFTHESVLTPRSFTQLASAAGFRSVEFQGCPPRAHGWRSSVRVLLWGGVAALLKFALTVETGARGHVVTQNFIGVARA